MNFKFFILMLFAVCLSAAPAYAQDAGTTQTQLNASLTIGSSSASGDDYIILSQFNDLSGVPAPYLATEILAGFEIWDGKCDRYVIDEVVQTVPFLEVRVSPLNSDEPFVAPSTGVAGVFENTENYSYPLEWVGIPEKLERCMENHFRIEVDIDIADAATPQVATQTGNTVTISDGGGSFSVDDGDSDATNEIQNADEVDIDDAAGNYTSNDVEGALAEIFTLVTSSNAADADADPTNEIQNLSLSGNDLTISGGNTVSLPPDGDSDATNEIQSAAEVDVADAGGFYNSANVEGALQEIGADLAADADTDASNELITSVTSTGGNITITDPGATYTVPGDDIDNQTLTLSGNTLSIDNGNGVDLSGFVDGDGDSTNEIQDAAEVDVADAGGFYNSADVEGALQEIGADLAADADTDATNEIQSVSRTGTDVELSLGGGTVSIADNDNDSANELITDFSATNGNIAITDAGGTTTVAGDAIDNQNLSYNSTTQALSLDNGGTVTLNVDDADSDPTNEIQDADAVDITDAGGNYTSNDVEGALAEIAADFAADADGDSSNEIQQLSRTGNQVELSLGGGTVNIEDGDSDDTNESVTQFAVNGSGELSITDSDNTFTVAGDLIDNQQISNSVSGTVNSIEIENGGAITVDVADNDNDSTNEIQTAGEVDVADAGGFYASDDVEGVLQEIGASVAADADGDSTNEIQTLSVSETGTVNSVALSLGGGTVDIDVADNDNDATNELITEFTAVNGSLSITDAGGTSSVVGSAFDNQTLSLAGNQLSIADGNTVDLSTVVPESKTFDWFESAADGVEAKVYGLPADIANVSFSRSGNTATLVIPVGVFLDYVKVNVNSGAIGGSSDFVVKVVDRNGGRNTSAANYTPPTFVFIDRDNLNADPPTPTLPFRNRADNPPTPLMQITGFGTDGGGGTFIDITVKNVDSYGLSTLAFSF